MATKDDRQVELPIAPAPGERYQPEMAIIQRQPTWNAAIRLCVQCGGFTYEKELYMPLGIDPGNWSRIMRGDANFPLEKLDHLMELCGNEIPLLWWAARRGYDLTPKRSALERQLQEALDRNRELEKKIETITEFQRATRGGV